MPIEDIKDVRPPVDLPPNYFWLFIFLILILLGGIFLFVRWLYPKLKKQKPVLAVVRPAWEIAFEELAALEKADFASRGEVKEYFIRLSSIVRYYLERRFLLSAPEMTTDEFLLHMKSMTVINEDQKVFLKDFLIVSDMVKFARYGASMTEMASALSIAKRLVEETTPKVESPQVEK